mgnify:CR=1 FL=1
MGKIRLVDVLVLAVLAIITAVVVLNILSPSGPTKSIEKLAPNFKLETPEGEIIELAKFRGKVVVLDFFATWCGPCVIEMKHLKEIYEEFKDSIVIISINIREDPKRVKDFMKKYGIEWIVVLDKDGSVASKYKVTAIPTIIIIDKEGRISLIRIGVMEASQLRNAIKKVLSG